MRFYKSFVFLLGLNVFLILPIGLFLDLRYLIPAFVFLVILDLFLLFFSKFYLSKNIPFSVFPTDEPYGIRMTFDKLKKYYNQHNVSLFSCKGEGYYFFCFQCGRQTFIVLSESVLEAFSRQDIEYLLNYPFQMNRSGDLLFLTILSNFLFLMEKLLYLLNQPWSFFSKKPRKKEGWFLVLVLKIISLMTRGIFYNADKQVSLKDGDRDKQALFLWKLSSLMQVQIPQVSLFLAPLFLMNPLTDSDWGFYISLQPLIKDRVKALTVAYPP